MNKKTPGEVERGFSKYEGIQADVGGEWGEITSPTSYVFPQLGKRAVVLPVPVVGILILIFLFAYF